MNEQEAHQLAQELRACTGTERWYRHGLNPRITFTDGVKLLADKAGAYWLVDAIVANQLLPEVKREEFQVWNLDVDRDNASATLTCEDGDYRKVYEQKIAFTDFPPPLSPMQLYFCNGVVHLPSEY